MEKKREIIAILNTCRISGLEVSVHIKGGRIITGKLQGIRDDDIVTILNGENNAILDIALTDIRQIEYFGNWFRV